MPRYARSIQPFDLEHFVLRLGDAAGNGKADALVRRAEDRRIDADDFALDIDQRSARVAGVHRRVGLQIFLIQIPRCAAMPLRRDFELTMPNVKLRSRPNGLPSAHTRSPTCNSSLSPHSAAIRFGQVDFQHRQVGDVVGADDRSPAHAAVGQMHFESIGRR